MSLKEKRAAAKPSANGRHPPPRTPPRAVLLNMADVERKRIEWVWYPWLAAGEMAKSTLSLDWIARMSRGWAMPPSAERLRVREPARVVVLSAEDDPAAVIRPRLDAAGADCSMVDFFPRVQTGADAWRLPTLPDDLELLAEQIPDDRRPRLVVVDPLMAFVGSQYDSNKDADIRHCLHRAAESVRSLGAALLVVRHLNKMNLAPALYRGGGSIGIIGAARIAMTVGHDPGDRQKWVLANNKNNLAPKPLSLVYRVESDAENECGKIEWLGESDLTPDEILAHDAGRPSHRPADRLVEAVTFLREQLAGGNVPSDELDALAEKKGIRNRTLKAARKELSVEAFRIGSEWFCRLPPDPDIIPP
jgi:hypothetical protein